MELSCFEKIFGLFVTLRPRRFIDSKSPNISYLTNLKNLHTLNLSSCEFEGLEIESASQTQHIRELPSFLSLCRVYIARCRGIE